MYINLIVFIYINNNIIYKNPSQNLLWWVTKLAFAEMAKAIELIRVQNFKVLDYILGWWEVNHHPKVNTKSILLSIGGDPELPVDRLMQLESFKDSSCQHAAEVPIPPLYILLDNHLTGYIETTTKVVVEYLIWVISIWERWLKYMGYRVIWDKDDPMHVYDPYGGHIHFRVTSMGGNSIIEDITDEIKKILNTIGTVKAFQWWENERVRSEYYKWTLQYKKYYSGEFDSSWEGSPEGEKIKYIHLEWRNPPVWVWEDKYELFTIIAPVISQVLATFVGEANYYNLSYKYMNTRLNEI